jgi:hypothetical protein
MMPDGQALSQTPQCCASLVRSAQVPPQQDWSLSQACMHDPQLSGSDEVSMQVPPHICCVPVQPLVPPPPLPPPVPVVVPVVEPPVPVLVLP